MPYSQFLMRRPVIFPSRREQPAKKETAAGVQQRPSPPLDEQTSGLPADLELRSAQVCCERSIWLFDFEPNR